METGEAPPTARLEVFSAVFENTYSRFRRLVFKDVFGVLLLRTGNRNFPIFDSKVLDPPLINPQGHLTLTCPKHSIPVKDQVLIFPWFIDMLTCFMDKSEHLLWKADVDDLDRLICRTIDCHPRKLHVNFAVYHDPVETHLDMCFKDLGLGCGEEEEDVLIWVHGTVSSSNSLLPDSKARSILFHKLSGDCVSLEPGVFVPLPLSRKITLVPHQSTLLVHVSLQVRMGHLDLSFEDTVEFNRSSDAEEFFIPPKRANHVKLLLKVTWAECEDRLE